MKDLEKSQLMEVEGGNLWWELVNIVYDVVTGEGPIGHAAAYTSYYRSQMPANWTGHGY